MSKFVGKSHYEIKNKEGIDKNYTESITISVLTLVDADLNHRNNERVS